MSAIHEVLTPAAGLDVPQIRAQFPILGQRVHGKPLVFLDNAASSQKPQAVLDAITACYTGYYANIHRGVYVLSERSTAAYDAARETVRGFLNAASGKEIIFVRGATEAINLVAASFGPLRVGEGDEILITHMEHHANIVPWQFLCQRQRARLKVVPVSDAGDIVLEDVERLLSPRTRLVSVVHLSNALGTL
ncbi:MAG: aminotransferase class V-fold PLP-dependent enzyme, partial [Pseudomonadota bacterium]|nr:aminotransferase class V-fold PLP-dependent enzyme [Pseudomonadota bacterium]